MKTSIKTIGLLVVFAVGLTGPLFSQVPDLTKDTKTVDRELTYNLGATGLRGWISDLQTPTFSGISDLQTPTFLSVLNKCRWNCL